MVLFAFRFCIVVILLVLCAVPRSAPAQPLAGVGDLPALNIVAAPEMQAAAAQIERLDKSTFLSVMRLVGLHHAGPPINVILAAEQTNLARNTPIWIAGFAQTGSSTIVLFPARTPSYPHDSMEALVQHEVAHILNGRAAGGRAVPRWFHEGLALAAERASRFTDQTRLAIAVVASRHSIRAIDAEFDSSSGAAARAYAVSGAFVRDLLNRYGSQTPARLLRRLSDGTNFDAAFVAATGVTLDEAERAFWRDSWWYQVIPFATSSLVIWTGIMFLALLAVRRRAERRAALRARWEEDASSENPQGHEDAI